MDAATTKVIGSVFVPRDHVEFVDAAGQRIAYVELKPVYKILSGDPMDSRICAAKINMAVLAEYARSRIQAEVLLQWQPTGKPN